MMLKAHAKDPRPLLRSVQGYDPSRQADQAQLKALTEQTDNAASLQIALQQAQGTLASRMRVQCDYTPYAIIAPFAPFVNGLIVPRNPNRSDLILINLGPFEIYMSFDAVSFTGPVGFALGAGGPPGFHLAVGEVFQEANGVIGINDIFVNTWSHFSNASRVILAYEGTPKLAKAA